MVEVEVVSDGFRMAALIIARLQTGYVGAPSGLVVVRMRLRRLPQRARSVSQAEGQAARVAEATAAAAAAVFSQTLFMQ